MTHTSQGRPMWLAASPADVDVLVGEEQEELLPRPSPSPTHTVTVSGSDDHHQSAASIDQRTNDNERSGDKGRDGILTCDEVDEVRINLSHSADDNTNMNTTTMKIQHQDRSKSNELTFSTVTSSSVEDASSSSSSSSSAVDRIPNTDRCVNSTIFMPPDEYPRRPTTWSVYTPPTSTVSLPSHFTCGICLLALSYSRGVPIVPPTPPSRRPAPTYLPPPLPLPYDMCRHIFCHTCIEAYLVHEIEDGQVLKIRCPGQIPSSEDNKEAEVATSHRSSSSSSSSSSRPCRRVLTTDFIRDHTSPSIFEKYERFVQLQTNRSMRSCPNCQHLQQRRREEEVDDQMTCQHCSTVYCFRHDLAHRSDSTIEGCQSYERKLLSDSEASLKFIQLRTIGCPWPTCPARIEKDSGSVCNEIQCRMCRTNLCYLCGGMVWSVTHFMSWNIFGCPGRAYYDGAPGCRNQWWRHAIRWTLGPLTIILLLFLLLLLLSPWLIWLCLTWPCLLVARRVIRGHILSTRFETPLEQQRWSKRQELVDELCLWGPRMIYKIWSWR